MQSFIINLSDFTCKALGYLAGDQEILQIRGEYFYFFRLNPDVREIITPGLIKEVERAHLIVQSYMNLS
jgi:hypothetical protein